MMTEIRITDAERQKRTRDVNERAVKAIADSRDLVKQLNAALDKLENLDSALSSEQQQKEGQQHA